MKPFSKNQNEDIIKYKLDNAILQASLKYGGKKFVHALCGIHFDFTEEEDQIWENFVKTGKF